MLYDKNLFMSAHRKKRSMVAKKGERKEGAFFLRSLSLSVTFSSFSLSQSLSFLLFLLAPDRSTQTVAVRIRTYSMFLI